MSRFLFQELSQKQRRVVELITGAKYEIVRPGLPCAELGTYHRGL